MSTEQTQHVMKRYFELMGRAEDFAECYSADVTWLVADTGEIVRGPRPVRDFVNALHATLVDAQTRTFVVGEDNAFLEGDCAVPDGGSTGRDRYCVAYDVQNDVIVAMRCYGLGDRSTVLVVERSAAGL